jgi:hypothetical protein
VNGRQPTHRGGRRAPGSACRGVRGAGTLPEEASVRPRQRAAAYLVEIHKKLAIAAARLRSRWIGIPIARASRGGDRPRSA